MPLLERGPVEGNVLPNLSRTESGRLPGVAGDARHHNRHAHEGGGPFALHTSAIVDSRQEHERQERVRVRARPRVRVDSWRGYLLRNSSITPAVTAGRPESLRMAIASPM